MQKKNNKIIKLTIAIVIIILLLLLLIIFTNISNKQNKLALYENTPEMLVSSNPNPPKLSAGMIPIKWNGENFVITTKNDEEWYNSKPAFIMLNDGYYKSELERGVKNEQLMQNSVGNDAIVVPNVPNNNPTIFMWVPRFVYKETGEIGYIKEETTPGEDWTLPDLFMYKTADETKPDFSLSGVWVEKDIDTAYSTKITQMNQEESIYGFLAHTKAMQITTTDTNKIQKYVVGNDALVVPLTDITNPNRIILKILNNNQHEPIKANITYNTVDKKIEIKVTYTKNGISSILDEYGNAMTLTEENRIIKTDTGSVGLAKGTYYFTIIDNKGNKKELSITPNIDSLFKVAYISGTDNMDINATYKKTQETKTSAENTLLNQITATDATKTFSRAIQDSNKAITAIGEEERGSDDEKLYIYSKYNVRSTISYTWVHTSTNERVSNESRTYGWPRINLDYSTGSMSMLGTMTTVKNGAKYNYKGSGYVEYWSRYDSFVDEWLYERRTNTSYSRGDFNSNTIALNGTYTIGSSSAVHKDGYWYIRNSLAPKYSIYKYDSNLALKSTYDVDTKTLTTVPIDISNKGQNKLKLTLNATGTNYKTYISSDNTNWQEVTDITSGAAKELNVDGWNSLYIKIETNTSRIDNIDIAYYKD